MIAEIDAVIAAARERATVAVQQGIEDLRAAVATAPEWVVEQRFNGVRAVVPKRAMLAGMLEFIESARERREVAA